MKKVALDSRTAAMGQGSVVLEAARAETVASRVHLLATIGTLKGHTA